MSFLLVAIEDQAILNSVCDILQRLCKKVSIVSEIPLLDDVNRAAICLELIDKNKFSPCKDIQGQLNHEKLRQSFDDLNEMLTALIRELQTQKTYQTLINAVDKCAANYVNLFFIMKNYQRQRHNMNKFKHITDLMKHDASKIEVKDDTAEMLYEWKYAYHQSNYDIKLEKRFQVAWISSQVAQNDLRLKKVEDGTLKKMATMKTSRFNKRNVFKKIKSFYDKKVEELQAEVTRMSSEYDKQIDEVEFRYQIAAEDMKRYTQMVDSEMKLYAKREQEMLDYIAMKQKKAAENKLREMQEVKAIKLQSWWRGEMVRRFRGPFKHYKARSRAVQDLKRHQKAANLKSKNKKK